MKLDNTITHKKEQFKPLKKNLVSLYTCGPTVYDYAHIGNLRTHIFEDILKRALLFNGFKVRHIRNITDVDDKTIRKAIESNESLKVVTARYTKYFKEDTAKLNILPPDKFAPATLYIRDMIKIIERLIEKKFAYEKDGSVYFKIKKFKNYGKLSQIGKRELKSGATVNVDEYDKENPADFVLWKAWTEKDRNVFWQSPWGNGRPGWHIECSAIAAKELGQPFDIHTGGVDLIFPHHENEIAQSEAAAGKKLADYWLHGEHLLVDNQKMSKSLKNFYTLADLEEKGFNPLSYRYFVMQAHYKSKLNFTWEALGAAENALNKIYDAARGLASPKIGSHSSLKLRRADGAELEKKFKAAIDDDLNIPEALAVLWELLKSDNPPSAKAETLLKFDQVLGLDIKKYLGKKIKVPKNIIELVKKREAARAKKDWQLADKLRAKIEKSGFGVEDTGEGYKIMKK